MHACVPQGDPSAAPYAVENAKQILGKKPVFGICMGHQILGQAFGGKTFKLKFGHHGGNHPIRHNPTGGWAGHVHSPQLPRGVLRAQLRMCGWRRSLLRWAGREGGTR